MVFHRGSIHPLYFLLYDGGKMACCISIGAHFIVLQRIYANEIGVASGVLKLMRRIY